LDPRAPDKPTAGHLGQLNLRWNKFDITVNSWFYSTPTPEVVAIPMLCVLQCVNQQLGTRTN
jgi:hypothetical protein